MQQKVETELASHSSRAGFQSNHKTIASDHESKPLPAITNGDIDLGDPLKGEIQRYKYQKRVPFLFITAAVLVTISSIQYENSKSMQWPKQLNVALCIVLIALCTFALILAAYKSYQTSTTMANYVNYLLNIADRGDALWNIQSEYFGVTWVAGTLFHCVVQVIFGCSYMSTTYVDYEHPSELMVLRETGTQRWSLALFSMFVTACCYFSVSESCVERVKEIKADLLRRYSGSKVQSIDDNICKNRMKKWKDSKKSENRKYEILLDVCIAIFVRFGLESWYLRGAWLNSIIHADGVNDIEVKLHIFAAWLCCVETVFMAMGLYHIHTVMLYHYRFIYVITDELSHPIKSQTVRDMIGWWELRKFYLHCVIPLYVEGFSGFICGAIVCDIYLAVNMILILIPDEKWDEMLLSFSYIVYAALLSFKCTALCVSFHKKQLSHTNTINKEKLQITNYDLQLKEEMDGIKQVFEVMDYDILSSSKPLSLLEVRINANFMLFLRATFATATFAVLAQISAD